MPELGCASTTPPVCALASSTPRSMGLVIRLMLVVRTTGIFITAQHTSDEAKFEPRYSTQFV